MKINIIQTITNILNENRQIIKTSTSDNYILSFKQFFSSPQKKQVVTLLPYDLLQCRCHGADPEWR